MGSRYQFELMTEADARNVLAMDTHQAEFVNDRLRAQRRLLPVVSQAELERNRAYLASLASLAAHPRRVNSRVNAGGAGSTP